MYIVAQKLSLDKDGYPIKLNNSHLTGNLKTTFCGLKITNDMNLVYGAYRIEEWLMRKTTCKKCLRIASNMVLKMSVGKIEE